MRFDFPLDDILRSRSHIRVLRALHALPQGLPASGREIARRAGVTHPTASRCLGMLADAGVVSVARSVVADAYRLNEDHFLAQQFAELFHTESRAAMDLENFIRHQLLELTDKIEWATLFGSAVGGTSTSTSDVDLAIQCPPEYLAEVEEALEDVSEAVKRRFGNRVDPLVTVRRQLPRTGVWSRLEKEGLPLIRAGKAA